jgi:AcrR family transcriptional regulator
VVRSDALQNRARILAAALEAFTADGSTSMNQVAQRAGVGAGTLYRNFPTREALLLAVYQGEIDRIVETVPGLLADHQPLEALRRWTAGLVETMRVKNGLGDALSPSVHQKMTEQSYGPVIAAIAELLDAGKRDGTIRGDADPADFLQLAGALWRAAPGPGDRAPRMLSLILDGLSTHRAGQNPE